MVLMGVNGLTDTALKMCIIYSLVVMYRFKIINKKTLFQKAQIPSSVNNSYHCIIKVK